MASAKSSSLLVEAPEGRHFCQLHKSPHALAQAVALFAETGLHRGDAVILVASATRIELVLQKLTLERANAWRRTNQLFIHDSTETLRKFMRGAIPEWSDFRETVVRVLETAEATGRKIRVYGEMVNDLWRAGNTAAAIRLEEYWNELARQHRFSLFCGYELDGHDETSYAGPIDEIGRTHTDIPVTADEDKFTAAVDAASRDVLGAPLSETIQGSQISPGERALPLGRQMIMWLKRNNPNATSEVLERARFIMANE